MMNYNPHLKPWQTSSPNNVAGKGQIEKPGEAGNLIWQNRSAEPTAYENELGDALEKVFAGGALTPQDIVDGLNAMAFRTTAGEPWTVTGFEAEMARLGA